MPLEKIAVVPDSFLRAISLIAQNEIIGSSISEYTTKLKMIFQIQKSSTLNVLVIIVMKTKPNRTFIIEKENENKSEAEESEKQEKAKTKKNKKQKSKLNQAIFTRKVKTKLKTNQETKLQLMQGYFFKWMIYFCVKVVIVLLFSVSFYIVIESVSYQELTDLIVIIDKTQNNVNNIYYESLKLLS